MKLFAVLRDKAGVSELILDLPAGASALVGANAVGAKYPTIQDHLPRVALAVNREYVKPETVLNEGDELALIPPVSGG